MVDSPSHAKPESFGEQRAGERQDFSGAIPGAGANPNLWGSGAPLAPSLPNVDLTAPGTTFSMPQSSGALGGGVAPGASSGSTGGMFAGGLPAGLASAGIGAFYGMAPGMIAKALGVDPETAAYISTGAGLVAPAATAATTGALGIGTGAAGAGLAGAGAGLAAAAPALIGAAPLAAIMAIDSVGSIQDAERRMRHKRAQMQRFQRGLPAMQQDLAAAPGILAKLNNASPEEAAAIFDQLNTLAKNFSGGPATGNPNAPGFESILRSKDSMRPIQEWAEPNLAAADVGRLRAADIATRGGVDIQNNPYADPGTAARAFGSKAYFFDPESGAANAGAVTMNDWLKANYDPHGGISPEDLANAQAQGNLPYNNIPMWTEEGQKGLSGLQPGNMEKGLFDLFGGQLPNENLSKYGFGTGAMPGGPLDSGAGVGGAGKRSPQFLTPELDNRAEAGTGRLGGGRQTQADAGSPFGMGGAKRGGGMQVGGPQRGGGRPGGQAPFGGMARQTMMPQQGSGVQARSNRNQGVV